MKYAPGLNINWTKKELDKIEEIKNRPNRYECFLKQIPWDEHEKIIKIELKIKRIKAIRLLDECGINTIIIARLFNMKIGDVRQIIRRG